MRNRSLVSVLLAASLLLASLSCERTESDAEPTAAQRNAELLAIAVAYLKEHHPDWLQDLDLPSEVNDKGDYWEVTWQLDMPGGVPYVHIDKTTMKVVRAYHTQ
jgi:hypothetical protein